MRRTLVALSTAAALTCAGLSTAVEAQAAGGPAPGTPTPVTAANLLSPLSLAAGRGDSLYVSQNFAGVLDRVDGQGKVTALPTGAAAGAEVGAVSFRRGLTFFAVDTGAGPDPAPNTGVIKSISSSGQVQTVGDVAAFELNSNPDGNVTYGFRDITSATCLAAADKALQPMGAKAKYSGEADSHPYATLPTRSRVYVADAGGNDIVAVDRNTHRVSEVAVLPGTALHVTKEVAAAQKLPACTVGHDYWFEAVPTDVVKGHDGWLYVSTLPGGPEGPGLGARGSIYRVNPRNGHVRLFASGLANPTGLAFSGRGDLYVAELFGGKVSVIPRGSHTPRTFVSVPLPADVAVKDSTLYITTNAVPGDNTPPAGQIVKVSLGRDSGGCWDDEDDD